MTPLGMGVVIVLRFHYVSLITCCSAKDDAVGARVVLCGLRGVLTATQRYNQGFKRIKWGSAVAPYPDPATIYRRSVICDPADDMFEDGYLSDM